MLAEGRGAYARLDLGGVVLASAGLLGVVYATVRAGALGWTSTATLTAYAAGAALLGAFLWWERRSTHPMVPLRLFRSRAFLSANVANFLMAFAMFAGFLMLIQFFAHARGEGSLTVGLHTLFWTAMPMLVAPYAGRLGKRIEPAAVASGGLLLVAAGMLALALVESPDNVFELAPAMVAIGVGIGLVIPNIAAAALGAVPAADIGKASGILSTSRQVGSVAGVSVGLAIYEAAAGAGAAGVASGVSVVLFAAAAAAAAGALAAGARLPALAPLPAPAVRDQSRGAVSSWRRRRRVSARASSTGSLVRRAASKSIITRATSFVSPSCGLRSMRSAAASSMRSTCASRRRRARERSFSRARRGAARCG